MFPIALDLTRTPIFLIGNGEAFEKRKRQLEEAGVANLYSCHPGDLSSEALAKEEGWHGSVVVMVAGLDRSTSEIIAAQARADKKLVNVEDINDLCDFYFTAHITRGDLQIAISTGGASPTLAKRIRDSLAKRFGPEWESFTEEMKQHRLALRAEGKSMKEVMAASDAWLDQKGWLP